MPVGSGRHRSRARGWRPRELNRMVLLGSWRVTEAPVQNLGDSRTGARRVARQPNARRPPFWTDVNDGRGSFGRCSRAPPASVRLVGSQSGTANAPVGKPDASSPVVPCRRAGDLDGHRGRSVTTNDLRAERAGAPAYSSQQRVFYSASGPVSDRAHVAVRGDGRSLDRTRGLLQACSWGARRTRGTRPPPRTPLHGVLPTLS